MNRLAQLQAAKTELWNNEYELNQLEWTSPITFYSNAFFKRILSPYQDSIWVDVYLKGMFLPHSFKYREKIRVYQITPQEAEDLELWGLTRESYLLRYVHFETGEDLIYLVVPALYAMKSHFETQYHEVTQRLYESEELMLGLQLWIFGQIQCHHRQRELYVLYGEQLQFIGDRTDFIQQLTAGQVPIKITIRNLQTQTLVEEVVQVDTRWVKVGDERRYRWLQYASTPLILFGKEKDLL